MCSSAPPRRHAPRRHTSATPPPHLRRTLPVAKPIRALPYSIVEDRVVLVQVIGLGLGLGLRFRVRLGLGAGLA